MERINHDILQWARKTAGLSLDEAVRKLAIKDTKKQKASEILTAYENGEKTPTRNMLVKMAGKYRRPLLTFYLNKIPATGDRGEDFRTLPQEYGATENATLDALLRDIKVRQNILKAALIDEDEDQPLTFIGSCSLKDNIQEIAVNIIDQTSFSLSEFRAQKTSEDAFQYLRAKIETAGIYVILLSNLGSWHTTIDANIFRGFALSDEIAPFIVINDQDSKNARSFSLLHELVHLWLGQSGISGGSFHKRIEKFCNDVASEILFPDPEVKKISIQPGDFDAILNTIENCSKNFQLSKRHVAYRLYRNKKINQATWSELDEHYQKEWQKYKNQTKQKNQGKEGGPDYYVVRRHKLGNSLINLTRRMVESGTLTVTRAATVLGVKPLKVQKLLETEGESRAS